MFSDKYTVFDINSFGRLGIYCEHDVPRGEMSNESCICSANLTVLKGGVAHTWSGRSLQRQRVEDGLVHFKLKLTWPDQNPILNLKIHRQEKQPVTRETEAIPWLDLQPSDMTTCLHKYAESAWAAIVAQWVGLTTAVTFCNEESFNTRRYPFWYVVNLNLHLTLSERLILLFAFIYLFFVIWPPEVSPQWRKSDCTTVGRIAKGSSNAMLMFTHENTLQTWVFANCFGSSHHPTAVSDTELEPSERTAATKHDDGKLNDEHQEPHTVVTMSSTCQLHFKTFAHLS